jgi:hypothetical protein
LGAPLVGILGPQPTTLKTVVRSPDEPDATAHRDRLQQLIDEQAAAHPAVPPAPAPKTAELSRIGVGLAMALTLVVGLQLGAAPWRFRREIWQVQGGLVGLAIGIAIGRFSVKRPN